MIIKKIILLLSKWIECEKIKFKSKKELKTLLRQSDFKYDLTCLCLIEKNKNAILNDAECLVANHFQIYNYQKYNANYPNWLKDPVSGIEIKKNIHINLISSSRLINNVDIKNYWEQSNQHWLVTLAQAYLITKEEQYAEKIIKLIINWSKFNPCAKTINWKCTMDVAIRLSNWILAITQIKDSKAINKHIDEINRFIWIHVNYIYKNLENKGEYSNNHYISNLIGLLWGTTYLQKIEKNESINQIYNFALQELAEQCNKQTFESGFNYEMSTYYHCFVTELIVHTVIMLQQNGLEYPKELKNTGSKMLFICEKLGAFDNSLPLFGDQDGSRLFHLKGCFGIDRNDFSDVLELVEKHRIFNIPKIDDVTPLTQGGVYLLRKGKLKCYIKCGGIGTSGVGTHDHNDHLSINIVYNDIALIVDPGTGVYTKNTKKRNLMRSIEMHNTLKINKMEQNSLNENCFKLDSVNASENLYFTTDKFKGRFNYQNGVVHYREVKIDEKNISILDSVDNVNNSSLNITAQFILPTDTIKVEISNNKVIAKYKNKKIIVETEEDVKVQVEECDISISYGVFTQGTKLLLNTINKEVKTSIKIVD